MAGSEGKTKIFPPPELSLDLPPHFKERKNLIYNYNFDHDILRPEGVVSNFIAAEYTFTSDLPYVYFFVIRNLRRQMSADARSAMCRHLSSLLTSTKISADEVPETTFTCEVLLPAM